MQQNPAAGLTDALGWDGARKRVRARERGTRERAKRVREESERQ